MDVTSHKKLVSGFRDLRLSRASMKLENGYLGLEIDDGTGALRAFRSGGESMLADGARPLFRLRIRDERGEPIEVAGSDAGRVSVQAPDTAPSGTARIVFDDFPGGLPLEVRAFVTVTGDEPDSRWTLRLDYGGEGYVEWIDYPVVAVPDDLPARGGDGRILWPAFEGIVVEDASQRARSVMPYAPVEYPNRGWCGFYPSAVAMQFFAYWREGSGAGMYFAAHDATQCPKEIEYVDEDGSIRLMFKTYPGAPRGRYDVPFALRLGACRGDWHEAAERYRAWAEAELPHLPKPLHQRREVLPWAERSPVVVSYPVRGAGHHSGPTEPNEYYPFVDALPHLRALAERFDAPLLVLLMHWEGTAPWAPPYVWPPMGGEEGMREFADKLHREGHLLGLYCSGLAWTNVSDTGPGDYRRDDELERHGLIREMCRGPKGEYECLICNGEGIRRGYDMCARSEFAREVLAGEAVKIARSGVDYIQLLDQNIGGSAYQCHDRRHGHAPAPGPWQSEAMHGVLDRVEAKWREAGAPSVPIGCEAAAGEPMLDRLPINDLRYQIGYNMGKPVPAYAYVFNPYVANFMGNQVEVLVWVDREKSPHNLRQRLAYSFVAGDILTVILADGGDIHWSWCTPWSTPRPEQEPHLRLVRAFNDWRKGAARRYLLHGRMLKPHPVEGAGTVPMHLTMGNTIEYPSVMTTRWRSPEGAEAQLLANYMPEAADVRLACPEGARCRVLKDPDGEGGEATTASAEGVSLHLEPESAALVEFVEA